jgi:hypothetical protein
MSASHFSIFSTPESYISGASALSVPDEGRSGGDWHFIDSFCGKIPLIHSAGVHGTLINSNSIFGERMIVDKTNILRKYGAQIGSASPIFCAEHPRAIADLIYRSLSKRIYPAHVEVEDIFDDEEEYSLLNDLLCTLTASLDSTQRGFLNQWIQNCLKPIGHGNGIR